MSLRATWMTAGIALAATGLCLAGDMTIEGDLTVESNLVVNGVVDDDLDMADHTIYLDSPPDDAPAIVIEGTGSEYKYIRFTNGQSLWDLGKGTDGGSESAAFKLWHSPDGTNSWITPLMVRTNGDVKMEGDLEVDGKVEAEEFYFDNGTLAIGYGTGTNCVFGGESAGDQNSANYVQGIGYRAAYDNTADHTYGFGHQAACNNDGYRVTGFGSSAAHNNSGSHVDAIGHEAAYGNVGSYVFAAGKYAGYGNEGGFLCAVGYQAAWYNAGDYINALGAYAGRDNTGDHCSFLGRDAGRSNSVDYVNIIGRWASGLSTVTERSYLSGDLELYDPPDSGGSTSGNLLKFQGGATIQASGSNIYFAAGSVGIGTNSPSEDFHVAGNAKVDGELDVASITLGGDTRTNWPSGGDSTWDGGATGLDAALGRTSLGLGSAATSSVSAFATADLSSYAGSNLTYSAGQFHAQAGSSYTDDDATNAVATAWPDLDTDSTDDYGYSDVTNAVMTAWPNLDTDKTDDSGSVANWATNPAVANVSLSGYWLSNDGDSEGVFVAISGNVGIGTNAPSETLEIAGTARVSGGITYVAPLGDVPMGIYTNAP